jgi:hypothetical protein
MTDLLKMAEALVEQLGQDMHRGASTERYHLARSLSEGLKDRMVFKKGLGIGISTGLLIAGFALGQATTWEESVKESRLERLGKSRTV